ncbi:MAG: hypothetical protein OP8BY_0526 [Candidatus Saccharicenans subterraneus]|uniref:Uncharacterized protein n=1 Tax=Candidatus Saccharicenans subterraneus TaxID=2508984 RepID=A0A3E2BKH1_9BACT|nr:MAG: hypothetical protein OP8BY_0526 [Candidatus Saccharicenans subterraneum]
MRTRKGGTPEVSHRPLRRRPDFELADLLIYEQPFIYCQA